MVRSDHMFVVFALYERKNHKRRMTSTAVPERRRGHVLSWGALWAKGAAAGPDRQLRTLAIYAVGGLR